MTTATAFTTRMGGADDAVTIETTELPTPLGRIVLGLRDGRLCALGFEEQWPRLRSVLARRFGAITWRPGARSPLGAALDAYFHGDVGAIDDVATDYAGTPFQETVWAALRRIPAGQTWSYRELASAIGHPAAVRAVGLANGANPIAIVVPCHRVIGADGSLTGYGGGLARKAWLLRHEGAPFRSRERARPDGLAAERVSGDLFEPRRSRP